MLLGNYTGDVTALGTLGQLALGLAGLDTAADIRDLTYDLTHWEWTPGHMGQTALDAVGFLPLIGAFKHIDEAAAVVKGLKGADDFASTAKATAGSADELAAGAKGVLSNAGEAAGLAGPGCKAPGAAAGAQDELGRAIEAAWNSDEIAGELIDGIKITDSKVGGKIPVDDFKTIRQSFIKNPDSNSMTFGKFTDDATSYTQRAGTDSSYFDLGSEWGAIKQKYGLNNNEMFDYFNKSALDDALSKGKTIRFSHNPLDYNGSFLADEWEYLKKTLNLMNDNLEFYGGFWYVR